MCRPRFDVATFIANEDSLDCRGLRRGEGLRLLRWPTAPSSSMGSIRIRSVSSPAAVLRGRRPRARWARSAAFPQLRRKHGFGARSWLQFYECLGTSSCTYSDFAICSCGGILQICQWYRVCDAGALRAEPVATLYILRGQKKKHPISGTKPFQKFILGVPNRDQSIVPRRGTPSSLVFTSKKRLLCTFEHLNAQLLLGPAQRRAAPVRRAKAAPCGS